MTAELGLSVPPELRRVLGDVVGAKVDFELAIAHLEPACDGRAARLAQATASRTRSGMSKFAYTS